GQHLTVRIRQDSNRAQHLLGRFRLAASTADINSHETWAKLPAWARATLDRDSSTVDEDKQRELAKYFRSIDPGLDSVRSQIEELRNQDPRGLPPASVREAAEHPREPHIMIRENFLSLGGLVQPAVPAALHPLPPGPTNRLTFARWLVSPDNPLVGRVTMNR